MFSSKVTQVSAGTWIFFLKTFPLSKKLKTALAASVFFGLWEQFLTKNTVFQFVIFNIEPQKLIVPGYTFPLKPVAISVGWMELGREKL